MGNVQTFWGLFRHFGDYSYILGNLGAFCGILGHFGCLWDILTAVFSLGFFMYSYYIPHRFICRPSDLCRRMLGLNPGLLRLWHWQSDALTTRLDLLPIGAFQKFCGFLGHFWYLWNFFGTIRTFWVLVGKFGDFLTLLDPFHILDLKTFGTFCFW